LLDQSGAIIGVIVGKLNALRVAIIAGDFPQNVNFAVSLDTLHEFLAREGISVDTVSEAVPSNTSKIASSAKGFTARVRCWDGLSEADKNFSERAAARLQFPQEDSAGMNPKVVASPPTNPVAVEASATPNQGTAGLNSTKRSETSSRAESDARAAREKAQRDAQAAREKAAREKAAREREARQKAAADKAAAQKEAADKAAKAAADRAERERVEREKAEKAAAEKAAADKAAREKRDAELLERERERLAREKQEAERQQKEREDRERQEQQRLQREKEEQERLLREREEQERLERQRAERETAAPATPAPAPPLPPERDRAPAPLLPPPPSPPAPKPAPVPADQPKVEDAIRLARDRDAALRVFSGTPAQSGTGTGGASSRGSAAFDTAPSDTYAGVLIAAVRPNIVFTERLAGNPAAEVEVTAEPDGRITGRRVSKSSGRRDWDEAVLRAIDRTRELPKDIDGRVPSRVLIVFRPND
jgi:colicin import membrane protein